MKREFPERPLLGVGAILLAPDLDAVLLVQRGHPPAAGQWTFPGGLVEGGETVRQAARRELVEETGLDVELGGLAFVAERRQLDGAGRAEYHYLILDLWTRCATCAAPRAASDAAAARWITLAELPALATTRGVPAAVQHALRLARGEAVGALFDE